jgi:hypothetical protein
MGGIVTNTLRSGFTERLQLTKEDVNRCRHSSQQFCYPNSTTQRRQHFFPSDNYADVENDWLEMEIEAEFMTELFNSFITDLNRSDVIRLHYSEVFVQAMLQMIAISFTQFKYPDQYRERFNSIALSTFDRTNATFEHCTLFKYTLDHVMLKILSHEYDAMTRKSWSKLMNSILRDILPLCQRTSTIRGNESEQRLYTSLENVVQL